MYLEKLTLNGFKSFAKAVELEFQPGITAVVGPNGSGKSNIADAIRWVLGEQSMKILRGKKNADVIFSGSEKAGRKGMAEVSLFLNNADHQMPIDYPEVAISRQLFADSTSQYLLNKSDVRMGDIQILLAKANFGTRTYSVIGQGMVDEVLAATPLERREFFEEAAGIKVYQLKREQSLNKLAATWENLQTAQVQLTEIEPHLRSLTRQIKRLEQRSDIEVRLREAQRQYYGHVWHEVHSLLAAQQGKLAVHESKQSELQRQVDEEQRQMASLTKETSHAERFEKLQAEFRELMNQKNKLRERELAIKTHQALERQEASRETVPRKVIEQLAREVAELHASWKQLQEYIARLTDWEDFEKWRSAVRIEDTKWQRLLEELHPYVPGQKNGVPDRELETVRDQIVQIEGKLESLSQRQQELASFEKKERTRIWQVQNSLQSLQRDLNDAVHKSNEAKVERARLETRLEDIQRELQAEITELARPEELPERAPEDPLRLAEEIRRYKHQLDTIGGIDPDVEKEYLSTKERFEHLSGEVTDLRNSFQSLEVVLKDLDSMIKGRFEESFQNIDREFQTYFKRLFNGGSAKLVLMKPEQDKPNPVGAENSLPLQDETDTVAKQQQQSKELQLIAQYRKTEQMGVEIHATPPGKRLKNISMLSGGERALTSIALICAIIANNPAPFVVLDEVDAALDEANSVRLADILVGLSHKTQFIVITHNRATMEKAKILYGVTMGDDGISQVLSLKFEEAAEHTNR